MGAETKLQRQVLDWARAAFPHAFARKIPNGPMYVAGGRKAKSPLAGVPDVLVVHHGRYIWMEVKVPGEPLSQTQINTHAEMRIAGMEVHLVYSLEDAKQAMESRGRTS